MLQRAKMCRSVLCMRYIPQVIQRSHMNNSAWPPRKAPPPTTKQQFESEDERKTIDIEQLSDIVQKAKEMKTTTKMYAEKYDVVGKIKSVVMYTHPNKYVNYAINGGKVLTLLYLCSVKFIAGVFAGLFMVILFTVFP